MSDKTAIYPCPECGGRGCPTCATYVMDQLKAQHRKHQMQEENNRDLRAEAIRILAAIAQRDGQRFDAQDPRVGNAILLATDILRYQREPKEPVMDFRPNPAQSEPAAHFNDGRDRWAMLEFHVPLKTAKQIELPPWRKDDA